MVSNINELVDEAVEIASQDFASVKVEKGEKAIKQEFLYLVNKIFSEKEFKLNPDLTGDASEGFRVYENGGNAFYSSFGALLLTFFAHYENQNEYTNIQFNPLKVRNMMCSYSHLDATCYYPLKIEVFSPKVFEKAQIFAKAYEYISGQKATIIKQFHEETVDPKLENIINSGNGNVKINEPLHFRVARWVEEQGYEIADIDGYKVSQPAFRGFGILKPVNKFLGFRKTAFHVGNIYLNWHSADSRISAREDKNWHVEVYGKEFLSELTQNVSIVSRKVGNIDVVVNLHLENPIYEKIRY